MSVGEIIFLTLILIAFGAFAATLAYYARD